MTDSTLVQICKGLRDTIKQGVATDLHMYDYVKDFNHFPAVAIVPDKADFQTTFNRASDEWFFNLFILVSTQAGDQLAQNQLRALCDGYGPDSVRSAIADNYSLGLPDVVANVYGLKGYGGKFQWNDTDHVGAILLVKVQYT